MVYVDALIDYGWKLGPSCHLLADEWEELHLFAQSIGMKRAWFQMGAGGEVPHYDLTKKRREAAVKAGAIEISRKELVEKIQAYKNSQLKIYTAGSLTLEKLETAIAELFHGKAEDYDNLKAKILIGYAYRFKSSTNLHTGQGGILLLIDQLMKDHWAPHLIEEKIEVYLNDQWYPLSKLTITKNINR